MEHGSFPIGATLAAAREARGLGLSEAEELTCMRSRYLAALEREDYAKLPGRAYTRAFLRTYANALGLDADKVVAKFEEQEPVAPAGCAVGRDARARRTCPPASVDERADRRRGLTPRQAFSRISRLPPRSGSTSSTRAFVVPSDSSSPGDGGSSSWIRPVAITAPSRRSSYS